jgi:uncharacterized integral membrane protein
MRIFYWAVRIAIFTVFFVFAVGNTDVVSIRYLPGQTWQAPLAFVLLLFFGVGILFGIVAVIGVVVRQRREVLGLRRTLRRTRTSVEATGTP